MQAIQIIAQIIIAVAQIILATVQILAVAHQEITKIVLIFCLKDGPMAPAAQGQESLTADIVINSFKTDVFFRMSVLTLFKGVLTKERNYQGVCPKIEQK